MAQTDIQKLNSIRFGSAKIEIGDSWGALTDIGAIRNLSLNSLAETAEILFDNTDSIKKGKNGKKFNATFDIAESDLDTIKEMNDGLFSVANTAGTLVSGASQVVAADSYAFNQFIKIENQNGDGGAITVNSVTAGTDGLLVADTDYYVGQNANGEYGIFILDSVTVTTVSQTQTIDYDYTPNASKTLTAVDSALKVEKVVRITNANSAGASYTVRLEQCSNVAQLSFPYPSGNDDEVQTVSVELEGVLVDIVDEQSVV